MELCLHIIVSRGVLICANKLANADMEVVVGSLSVLDRLEQCILQRDMDKTCLRL